MRHIMLIAVFLFGYHANASLEKWSTEWSLRLMRAQSAQEIEKVQKSFELLAEFADDCDSEKSQKIINGSCIRKVQMLEQLSIITHTDSQKERLRLDNECVEKLEGMNYRVGADWSERVPKGSRCDLSIRKAQEKRAYSEGDLVRSEN